MSIMKWDPLKDLFYMEKHIDRLINSSFKELNNNWVPPVDIIEDNEYIILIAELAGICEEHVEVTLNEGILTIAGMRHSPIEEYNDEKYYYKLERQYGIFSRSFAMPGNIDTDVIKASLKDGILKIILTKINKKNIKTIKIDSNNK